jgi:DNA-binding CsgD family transcriptional regulator
MAMCNDSEVLIVKTARNLRYLGFALYWGCTLVSFQSTMLFFPSDDVPSLLPHLFAVSISVSVLTHFLFAYITGRFFAFRQRLYAPVAALLTAGGISLIWLGGGGLLFPNPSIYFIVCGAAVIGIGNAWLDVAWSQIYGRLKPNETGIYIPLSVLLALLSYFLIASLCRIEPMFGPPSCIAMAIGSGLCLSSASRLTPEVPEALPIAAGTVPHIIKDIWRPIVGACAFSILFSVSEHLVVAKSDFTNDFNLIHDVSIAVSFVTVLLLVVFVAASKRRLEPDLAIRAALPILLIGLVLLPILWHIDIRWSNALVNAGCTVFDITVSCLIVRLAYDYRTSGGIINGIVRGITIGMSGIGALAASVIAPVVTVSNFGVIVIAVVLIYLVLLAAPLLIRRPLPKLDEFAYGQTDETEEDTRNKSLIVAPETDKNEAPNHHLPSDAKAFVGADVFPGEQQRIKVIATAYHLTRREADVLVYLVRGRSLRYISEKLILSEHTARGHIRHIYAKMAVHSKQELIDCFEGDQKN